jgi:hypothetical protein
MQSDSSFHHRWAKVRVSPPNAVLAHADVELLRLLQHEQGQLRPRKNDKIAIAVGSRKISGLLELLEALIGFLKAHGAEPFIIPAMGSHGGGRAEGQLEILRQLGIREERQHVPLCATNDLFYFTSGSEKVPTCPLAMQADGLILINRIKQHTSFYARLESGLVKMLVVGLGKEAGAAACHHRNVEDFEPYLLHAARLLLEKLPLRLGIGILEGPIGEIHSVHVLSPRDLIEQEMKLLCTARTLHPRLPFADVDILLVDAMGKDISGSGLDTHVIGRRGIPGLPNFPDAPTIQRIGVMELTEASMGNATGVGMADFITQKLYQKINLSDLYKNVLASTFIERAKIPVILANPKAILDASLSTVRGKNPDQIRLVRIQNTKQLETFFVSTALEKDVRANQGLKVMEAFREILFDSQGEFVDPF